MELKDWSYQPPTPPAITPHDIYGNGLLFASIPDILVHYESEIIDFRVPKFGDLVLWQNLAITPATRDSEPHNSPRFIVRKKKPQPKPYSGTRFAIIDAWDVYNESPGETERKINAAGYEIVAFRPVNASETAWCSDHVIRHPRDRSRLDPRFIIRKVE